MLVLRPSWQAALPCLTQIGNSVALAAELDRVLATQGSCAFMQVAPLLGLGPSPAGTLHQVCSSVPDGVLRGQLGKACIRVHLDCAVVTHTCPAACRPRRRP